MLLEYRFEKRIKILECPREYVFFYFERFVNRPLGHRIRDPLIRQNVEIISFDEKKITLDATPQKEIKTIYDSILHENSKREKRKNYEKNFRGR